MTSTNRLNFSKHYVLSHEADLIQVNSTHTLDSIQLAYTTAFLRLAALADLGRSTLDLSCMGDGKSLHVACKPCAHILWHFKLQVTLTLVTSLQHMQHTDCSAHMVRVVTCGKRK